MINKGKVLPALALAALFLLGPFAPTGAALDYCYWPLWPVKTYYPEPPKLKYGGDDEIEIVVDANSTEPMTFFSIGRTMMAWGDRMPMTVFETEILPKEAWGSKMELMDVGTTPAVIRKPVIPSNVPIYLGLPGGRKDLAGLTPGDLQAASVIPGYKNAWYAKKKNGPLDGENQEFTAARNNAWKSFLRDHQYLAGLNFRVLQGEDPLYIADAGHSAPVVVWHDNIWLEPMTGWRQFSQGLKRKYENYGGAVTFFATNDGRVHAFAAADEVDPVSGQGVGTTFRELWSFIPSPALLVAPYHEYWRFDAATPKPPRLVALDSPILIHDVEAGGAPGDWKRLLFGTMGQGCALEYKPKGAWNPSPSDSAPPSGIRGHLFGFYALDVTDPLDPKPAWSVSLAEWRNKDNQAEKLMWVDGDLVSEPPFGYSGYEGFQMAISRPVVGYTYELGERVWHLILLGINTDKKYVLYDIDPTTGKLRNKEILGNVEHFNDAQGVSRPNDVINPSRIAAVSIWRDDYPDGTRPRTPLLGEIYIFLSNGTLYKWNLQAATAPKLLVTLVVGQRQELAVPLQDFDATFLKVDGEPHRILALVTAFSKNGNPSDIVNTDHYGLVTIDVTMLERQFPSGPPEVAFAKNQWGKTNEVLLVKGYDFIELIQLAMRSPDPDNLDLGAAQGPHWNTAYTTSSPVFYDGKIILVTRSWLTKGKQSNRGAWSRTYVVDPTAGSVQKMDLEGVTHLGGALIDPEATLFLHTDEGVVSHDLEAIFGLKPLGGEGPEGEEVVSKPGVVYWKINRPAKPTL